jgi:hypothetical protein
MKKFHLLIFFTAFLLGCKRPRKIDIEGTLTDKYTGEIIPNINVNLRSWINNKNKQNSVKNYFVDTDSEGHYSFRHAQFSGPIFSGFVYANDLNYIGDLSESIDEHSLGAIGRPKLVRNIQAWCTSKLDLTTNVSGHPTWTKVEFTLKYIGPIAIDGYSDFAFFGNVYNSPYSLDTWKEIPAYPQDKIVVRSELKDSAGSLLKMQYDTITPGSIGKVVYKTIVVN